MRRPAGELAPMRNGHRLADDVEKGDKALPPLKHGDTRVGSNSNLLNPAAVFDALTLSKKVLESALEDGDYDEVHVGGHRSKISGRKAVHTAIATNTAVLIAKIIALGYTGSASVLSEVVHSVADLGNQCLLAVGIKMSEKEPDETHPYGYITERYVFSLISGCGIFFLGCGVSVQHGLAGVMSTHEIEHVVIGVSVLLFSFIVEGYSLAIAYAECKEEADRVKMSLKEYVLSGADPMNVSVLMEDSVAVLGVMVAGPGLMLAYMSGNSAIDSAGSIVNGILMGAVAIFLIQKNRQVLVGTAIPRNRLEQIIAVLEADDVVVGVSDIKAILVGADHGRFKASLSFDSGKLAQRCMVRMGKDMVQWEGAMNKGDVEKSVKLYSHTMLQVLGEEYERIESLILQNLPEVKHVDLQIL